MLTVARALMSKVRWISAASWVRGLVLETVMLHGAPALLSLGLLVGVWTHPVVLLHAVLRLPVGLPVGLRALVEVELLVCLGALALLLVELLVLLALETVVLIDVLVLRPLALAAQAVAKCK